MEKPFPIAILIFFLLCSSAQAIPSETMTHIRDACKRTLVAHPTVEDIKQGAYCKGYIKAQADKLKAETDKAPDHALLCSPNNAEAFPVNEIRIKEAAFPPVEIDQLIAIFLKIIDHRKKYGFDAPHSVTVPLLEQPPANQIPAILGRAFCLNAKSPYLKLHEK